MNQLNVKRFYQLSEKSQIDDPSNLYVVGVENETNCRIPSSEFLTKNIVKSVNSSEDLTLNDVKNNSDCLFVIGTSITELDLSTVIPSTMNSITITFTLTLDEGNTNEVTIKNVDEILGKLNQSQKTLSGKIIKDSTGNVYISVFKYALGKEGNDWITVNEAGEAVLNFPDETDPTIENIKLAYSTFTKVTGTTGGKQNCASLFQQNTKLQEVVLNLPSANTLDSIFGNCTKIEKLILTADNALDVDYLVTGSKIETADFYFPKATAAEGILFNNNILTQANIKLPAAKSCGWLINNSPMFVTFTFHLGEMQTLDLTQAGSTTKIGNLSSLENVTILEGGLASCTSSIITNSTNLTDESIQNIIDALPDYSGTETSALVSFPPDRLTEEQQEQLAAKNWTWS